MPKKSTVLAYVRCSTASQNEESQVMAIQEYCDNHNMEPVFYIDKATGKNLERDAMKKLQEDLFIGKSKTVVCYKLDRLSRQLVEGLNLLNDWLTSGVRVISITQQFDFSGATGKLISAVLMAVSEMEMGLREERVAIGIENAKKKGVYKGRKEGATKAKYKKAWDLYAKGLTMEEVGNSLGVSHRTATRYIDRTRSEWVMEDFRDAVWLVSKEKDVKAEARIEKDDPKNPKYPILSYQLDGKEMSVSTLLVKLLVRTFKADFPEARALNKSKMIDLIRGLEADDWVILKSLDASDGIIDHPKTHRLSQEQKDKALAVSTIREIQAGLRKRYKNKPPTKHLKECFGDQATKDLVIGDSYESYDLMTFKNIIKTKKFKEFFNN